MGGASVYGFALEKTWLTTKLAAEAMVILTKGHSATMIVAPSETGKSVLGTLLELNGISFISGPVHTDGPEDFARAAEAAHNIEECLPLLHDAVLEATGESLSDIQLRDLIGKLPTDIGEQINEWGLADTEVREQIYAHLLKAPSK